MSSLAPEILLKTPAETLTVHFDFSAHMTSAELVDSITSMTTAPSGLTIGNTYISGQRVQVKVSGGTLYTTYLLTAKVLTNLSNVLEGTGRVDVLPVGNP